MASTRKRAVAVLAVLALAPVLAGVILRGDELTVRFEAWRLLRSDPALAKGSVATLLARGERGVRVLEAVAFEDADLTALPLTVRVRQAALDGLEEREHWAGKGACSDERVARYLLEGRGLSRPRAADALAERPLSDVLRHAAIELVHFEPDESAAVRAVTALSKAPRGDREARATLRHAAVVSPFAAVRYWAANGLCETSSPEDAPVLTHLLADPEESVRVIGAYGLAVRHGDSAGLRILVAALRDKGYGVLDVKAVRALTVLGDKRAVLALARVSTSKKLQMSRGVARRTHTPEDMESSTHEAMNATLERLTGVRFDPEESWISWVEAHRAKLPPQLDPEALSHP